MSLFKQFLARIYTARRSRRTRTKRERIRVKILPSGFSVPARTKGLRIGGVTRSP